MALSPSQEFSTRIRGTASPPASGFSLVEVLVVITIIGVLIALLVVALGGAQQTVQQAAIVTEIGAAEQGLRSMTSQYSVDYPPDFSANPYLNNLQRINRYMSRMFRNRNPLTDVPRQVGGGPQPQLLENLDPSEALWFWLRGFSDDPQNPLFGPLNITDPTQVQRTPFAELDPAQLQDIDQDGFMEYYPRYGNQMPYVYYAHYNYVRNFVNPDIAQLRLRFSTMNSGALLVAPRPYLSTVTATLPNPWLTTQYASPDTFQIIACGLDGDFGEPVPNTGIPPQPTPGTSPPGTAGPHVAFAYPTGPYPNKPHLDNITSFAQGTLESDLP